MLRIVERVLGDGAIVAADQSRTRAGYQLAVYREWADQNGELVAGGFVVEGLVMLEPAALAKLLFTSRPLRLELEDGRSVAIYIVSEDGSVSGADDRGIVSDVRGARE